MYQKIVNPKTNRKVSVNSKIGKSIIKSYYNALVTGGSDKIPNPDRDTVMTRVNPECNDYSTEKFKLFQKQCPKYDGLRGGSSAPPRKASDEERERYIEQAYEEWVRAGSSAPPRKASDEEIERYIEQAYEELVLNKKSSENLSEMSQRQKDLENQDDGTRIDKFLGQQQLREEERNSLKQKIQEDEEEQDFRTHLEQQHLLYSNIDKLKNCCKIFCNSGEKWKDCYRRNIRAFQGNSDKLKELSGCNDYHKQIGDVDFTCDENPAPAPAAAQDKTEARNEVIRYLRRESGNNENIVQQVLRALDEKGTYSHQEAQYILRHFL